MLTANICSFSLFATNFKSLYTTHRCACVIQRSFGQPASKTHPHLLLDGEVTPGLSKLEYKNRRYCLMSEILRSEYGSLENHVVIIPSAVKTFMTQDIPYPFRQNTDFLYLTGFQEPDSVLLLETNKLTLPNHKSILFVPKKDAHAELWEGPRSGKDGSVELTGIDEAYNMDDFGTYLSKLLKNFKNRFVVWYDFRKSSNLELQRRFIEPFLAEKNHHILSHIRPTVQKIRMIKSDNEINLMLKSCLIASESFIETMKFSYPEVNEAYLYAKMDFECRIRGAEYLAYPPVVAGGNRANTIHYIANNQIVNDGDLVLMDAGCEYHGYASDITRTWPVTGQFTNVQRILYEAVLEVQESCIKLCVKNTTLNAIYSEMNHLLGIQLKKVGLLPPSLGPNETRVAVRMFCPHHVGHYLGMDVHDTDEMARDIPLQSGMIITIEPGIYIPSGKKGVKADFYGIGIRIEDNVLITDSHPVVLSSKCPKKIETIEALMKR